MAATERHNRGRGGPSHPGPILMALAFSLAAPACYTYTQVSPAAAAPGSSVRLRTASQAALPLGSVPLPEGGRSIQGTLLPGSSPDTLVCAVALSNGEPLAWSRGLSGTVLVPVAGIERLEVRHLQKGRTAAVVATGAVLSLVVLHWAFDVALPGKQGSDPTGGGNNMRRALVRLQWRVP